ncbi:MAG TPA: hypothetical protein VKU03_00750 [Roseiarcus sp.]|nr:hypothetical protein [Roseiarcus sp.]
MPAITVRNLSAETLRALKALAARHGRSAEAEIRSILEAAARGEPRVKLGSLLVEIGREFGGADLDVKRDKIVTEPLDFE